MAKPINASIAKVLAQKAKEKIEQQASVKQKELTEKISKSKEFKLLLRKYDELEESKKQFEELRKKTEEFFKVIPGFSVDIYTGYNLGKCGVKVRYIKDISEETLKGDILLESHFAGKPVTADEIIDKIVKKYGV